MYDTTVKGKKSKGKRALKVIGIILLVFVLLIALVAGGVTVTNAVTVSSEKNFAKSVAPVEYEAQLEPTLDGNGFYTFVTDGDFKVMQLTDIHIGAGFMSTKKDSMALNAVAAMITAEKPDLVCVSGDIAFPIPYQAGTINNKTAASVFAELMEQLGVYWAPVFGNHDTEAFSYYTRADIGEMYESDKYPHCLFQAGDPDVHGVGNYVINVKNSAGTITQSIFMIDSNDYVDTSLKSTINWVYDCIHTDQIDWYEDTLYALAEQNGGNIPKSIAFFHIPVVEMKDAWNEYCANGFADTENVQYVYGKAGEEGAVIYCSNLNNGFFDKVLELGSTQGIFNGHDHLNNFSLFYKGVRMTYGMSIDYLAYSGISTIGSQRGCTIITLRPDGSFDCVPENYYQEKYQPVNVKETVTMQEMENHVPEN